MTVVLRGVPVIGLEEHDRYARAIDFEGHKNGIVVSPKPHTYPAHDRPIFAKCI